MGRVVGGGGGVGQWEWWWEGSGQREPVRERRGKESWVGQKAFVGGNEKALGGAQEETLLTVLATSDCSKWDLVSPNLSKELCKRVLRDLITTDTSQDHSVWTRADAVQ